MDLLSTFHTSLCSFCELLTKICFPLQPKKAEEKPQASWSSQSSFDLVLLTSRTLYSHKCTIASQKRTPHIWKLVLWCSLITSGSGSGDVPFSPFSFLRTCYIDRSLEWWFTMMYHCNLVLYDYLWTTSLRISLLCGGVHCSSSPVDGQKIWPQLAHCSELWTYCHPTT